MSEEKNLATPEGIKAQQAKETAESLAVLGRAYVAAFETFPKTTCFLSGMVLAFIIAARKRSDV
jgi:hypothetical protein